MTDMASNEEDDEPVKSKRNNEQSFVKFVNRTRIPVDIIWKGFNGENIRYFSRLSPQGHYCANTFVSHPWQAWNSNTLHRLNVGGDKVFYPTKWNGHDPRTVVYIDDPVHSLVMLCLEKIKSLVNLEDTDKLEIPKILMEELKKRRTVDVQDYMRRQ